MAIWIALAALTLLLVAALAAAGWLFATLIVAAVDFFRHELNKESYPTCDTPLGRMTYSSSHWNTFRPFHDRELHVMLDDTSGQPDEKTLNYLVEHWHDLDEMADVARRTVEGITPSHEFGSVSSSVKGDICLGFNYEPSEDWGETVFVEMVGTTVVGWCTVD